MKIFKSRISANINRKGVLDIDTVKGCSIGMSEYPDGGCYGLCYAAKVAKLYNYDFSTSKKLVASQITQSRTLLEINRYPHYDLQGLAPFRFTFGLITSPDNSPTFRLSLNIFSGLFTAPNDLLIN